MFYTLKQLTRKLKRSEGFLKLCFDRFSIKHYRLKNTRQFVYDVPNAKLELIKEFSETRKK